ncbi:PHD-type domain-containing protein [Mycena indigotica]|uniref:PHD-type domain-containing protein n=1 Tax=Mycena indigotica TaxID=2126181 RepID=A0A8H6VV98_9AGAR|nr:PHD-type domain-containing protein [Mycena indigotica]KAF7291393.1 PHD-type domain-containing protein [Mycena indigotica]
MKDTLSAAVVPVLVIALIISHWGTIYDTLQHLYGYLNTKVLLTINCLVLVFYGFVLAGLVLEPRERRRRPKTRSRSRIKRDERMLVPLLDAHDNVIGMIPKDGIQIDSVQASAPKIRPDNAAVRSAIRGERRTFLQWDGWPNEVFHAWFTPQDLRETSNLAIHWVHEVIPGFAGSPRAQTPERGKQTIRRCLGSLLCDAAACPERMCVAPEKTLRQRMRQLTMKCPRGHALIYRPCDVDFMVYTYRNGALISNSGAHTHVQYTHSTTGNQWFEFISPPLRDLRSPAPVAKRDSPHRADSNELAPAAEPVLVKEIAGNLEEEHNLSPEELAELEEDPTANDSV